MNEPEQRVRTALGKLLGPIEAPAGLPAATLRRARRKRRIALASVVAGAVLAGGAAFALLPGRGERKGPKPAAVESGTGPYLYLSGKYGDVWRVSAQGDVVHAQVDELDPGDPPHRLLARGDAIVAWGYETYRIDPDLREPPELLIDDSLFFIPSAHEDRIWIATEEPGTNRRVATLREIDVDGRVTVPDVRPPSEGKWPVGAVRSGLVFHDDKGWFVWNPVTGEVVFRFAARDLGPSDGNYISSCSTFCHSLEVFDVTTGERIVVDPPDEWEAYAVWDGAFSPDGDTFAVPLLRDPDQGRLALVDLASATVTEVPGTDSGTVSNLVAWSADGTHVFYTHATAAGDEAIFVYEIGAERARRLDVDVGGFYDAAAL